MAALLAVAMAILLSRMLLSALLVPPWQQPDEPIHVSAAEVWRSRISGDDAGDRGRQADIIDSMIRHDWWQHYRQPLPPGPQPTRFVGTGVVFQAIGLEPESSSYAPPYYASIGWLLSLAPRGAVERDLYVMRVVSMAFAVGTLWVAFVGSRLALDGLGAATVTGLLAVHPQFAIVSTTAAPDAVVNFAGAVLWWQTLSALRQAHYLRSLGFVWLAAVAAATVDRMGIALIPMAFIVTVVVTAERLRLRHAVAVVVLTVLAMVVAVAALPAIRSPIQISFREAVVPSSFGDALDYTWRFTTFLFTSWWYSLGWGRYSAPQWWVIAVAVITAVATIGVAWRSLPRAGATRTVTIVAVANLVCLLCALGWVFLRVRVGAQGRYLFPAIVPTLTLVSLGTLAWLPARMRQFGSVSLVAAVTVLDLLAWILVAVPAYL
jgi:hypothetical protein